MDLQENSQKTTFENVDDLEQQDEQRLQDLLAVHVPAKTDTPAWKEMQNKEYAVGPEALMEELLGKKMLNDVEMLWIVRRMMSYYGKEDALLKKAPVRCLMSNTNELLRVIFLLLDRPPGEIETNMRSYLSVKLQQATWGINQNTRRYLGKINGKDIKEDPEHPPVFSL